MRRASNLVGLAAASLAAAQMDALGRAALANAKAGLNRLIAARNAPHKAEIAAHNAEVDRKRAEKKAAKLARRVRP